MSAAPGPDLLDIHMPAAPGWWPPAPGWWLLAALCIIVVYAALYIGLRIRRQRRWRRLVLAELDRAIDGAGASSASLAAALSQFLRRMTLRESPTAAALPPERWLSFLDSSIGEDSFSRGIGRVLLDAPFRADAHYDAPALIALVRRWTCVVLDAERRHA